MREHLTSLQPQEGDDPHRVCALDFADLAARLLPDRAAFDAAWRAQAVALDHDLDALGPDLGRVAAELSAANMSQLFARLRAAPNAPAPPPAQIVLEDGVTARAARLGGAVAGRADAAWVRAKDEVAARAEALELLTRRVKACRARLNVRDRNALISGDFEQTPALDTVKGWAPHAGRELPPILALLGPTGCGKSFAAAWWATRAACVVVQMRDLCEGWTAHYGHANELVSQALGARHLVVDELGREEGHAARQRGAQVLLEILDRRATPGHATILVSNRPGTDADPSQTFVGHYGGRDGEHEALLSRLAAHAVTVEVGGSSLRRPW